MQYARSRGDKTAPLYLADLICTSYGDAWSAKHADRTFELSRMLLAEVLRGGDSVLRIDAQVAMRSLFQLRLNAAIQNKKSREEKAYDAHVLIIGMKFINSKLPFASQAKREETLRNQLLGLVEQGSQEAFNEVIGVIKTRVEKGRATPEDLLVLAELKARGLPVPRTLFSQVAQTKSSFLRTSPVDAFLAKVEKGIKENRQTMTSESIRALAFLAVHGNDRAMTVLRGIGSHERLSSYFVVKMSVPERQVNRAIFKWALNAVDNGKVTVDTIIGEMVDGKPEFDKFYQRYIESPTKIELNIPVATPMDVSLLDVDDRADRGKITEKDIENLVFAAKNGNQLAESALKKAIVKMTDSRIKTSDGVEKALSFGKWALDNNFPDPETATFPNNNNNADVETRYKRVLAGPPQPGPSLGQQSAAFFSQLMVDTTGITQGAGLEEDLDVSHR